MCLSRSKWLAATAKGGRSAKAIGCRGNVPGAGAPERTAGHCAGSTGLKLWRSPWQQPASSQTAVFWQQLAATRNHWRAVVYEASQKLFQQTTAFL